MSTHKFSFTLLALFLLPWIVITIIYAGYKKNTLHIIPFPSNDSSYVCNTYTDASNNGKSVIHQFKRSDSLLTLDYEEREGFAYPYVGVNITAVDSTYIDLSSYDFFSIEISCAQCKIIPITLALNIPGFTKKENELTYRFMIKNVDINSKSGDYTCRLDEFSTPSWWYALFGSINESNIGVPNFSQCKFIGIQSCNVAAPGVRDELVVRKMSFHKDYQLFYTAALTLLVLYYFIFLVLLYVRKMRKNEAKKISIQYNSVEVESHFDEETKKVITSITSLYIDPSLDLEKIQKETGIHKNKISLLLKQHLDLNFKQFLNHLRIAEAKKLLVETDYQVSEIAYRVGYGNISHFNRVFKALEETSPNDFRKRT